MVSRNLPGCTEENHKKPPVSRSEVLPDSKQKQTLVDRNFRAQRVVGWNLRVNFTHFFKMIEEVRPHTRRILYIVLYGHIL